MPYVLLSALIVVLDQWYKELVVRNLGRVGASAAFLPGILRLTLVHNTGASWGILSGQTTLLLTVTALVCLAILCALLLDKPASVLGRLSFAFILGGAVGNALDRYLLGYVVDMIEVEFMNFAVFNIADCFITCGANALFVFILFFDKSGKKEKKDDPAA